MEKLIYLVENRDDQTIEALKDALFDRISTLRAQGASQITVNIADLSDTLEQDAPGRLMGTWQTVAAVVAFWIPSLDERGAIEDALQQCCQSLTGYLVTESVVQPFDVDWADGERRPGVTQFGANGKPPNVTDEEFYYTWQVLHSAQSFDLHPRRWSYVRNAVARPLTKDAPTYLAIVSEHFHALEDYTDNSRYFGSEEALKEMMEHMPGFFDVNNMFSLGMSEYYFH